MIESIRTNLGLSLVAIGLVSMVVAGCGDPTAAGCRVDSDCRTGRICVERLCTDQPVDGVDSGTSNNLSNNVSNNVSNNGRPNADAGNNGTPVGDMGGMADMDGTDMGTMADMGADSGGMADMDTEPVFGPSMSVFPDTVDYGFVPTNGSIDAVIRVSNVGDADLTLSSVELRSMPSSGFTVSAPNTTVAPGATVDVTVTFAPTQAAQYANAVVIRGDDPNNPESIVELTGRAFNQTFQSCMFTSPTQLDFGPVTPGTSVTADVTVGNCTQNQNVTFESATIEDGENVFSATSNAPVTLMPGDTETITVTFTPTSLAAEVGQLRIESDAQLGDQVDVVLTGGGGCAEADAEAELDAVMNDVPTDEPLAVILGGKVNLNGADSTSPSGARAFAWSVASAPANSTAAITGAGMESASFTPDLAGEYTLELEVTDPTSGAPSCGPAELRLVALASAPALVATVTWNADHDVDLHLLRDDGQGNYPPFGDTSNDLHYDARWLDWGMVGILLDDGFHLGDDPDGFGPERAAVGQLEAGRSYRVVAQFARTDGFTPATFDVDVAVERSGMGQGAPQMTRTRTFNLAERGLYWIPFEIDGTTGQIRFIDQATR